MFLARRLHTQLIKRTHRYTVPTASVLLALLIVWGVGWVKLISAASVIAPHDALANYVAATSCKVPSFGPVTNLPIGNEPDAVAVGDFNRDGNPDLAVTDGNLSYVSILLGDGTGGFGTATTFGVASQPISVAVGDFNSDGNPDLVVASYGTNSVSMLLGNGTGGFGTATNFALGGKPSIITIGDFNGDGNSDLASANYYTFNVSVLLGNGTGGLGSPTLLVPGGNPRSIALGDFNLDTNADLVTANAGNISVFLGDGSGGFGTTTNFVAGTQPRSVAPGDFNHDSNPDVAVGHSDSVWVLLGDGTGGFGAPTNFNGPCGAAIAVDDFNHDGHLDLAGNGGQNTMSVFLGNGTGGFGIATEFTVGSEPFSVSVGDFNRDGSPDLATANLRSDDVSVLLNTCDGGSTATPMSTTTPLPTLTRTPTLTQLPSTSTTTSTATNGPPTQTATPTPIVGNTPSPTCGAAWRVVSSPNVGSDRNFLFDVDAFSADDIWAVGRYDDGLGTSPRTLTMHWNGSQWSIVPSPNVGPEWNELRGVTAIATNDVWAVGHYGNGNNQTLTMHWNGTQWSIVPSPNPGLSAVLYRVAATSSTDVWAAGDYSNGGRDTLTMHWDGLQWTIVPSPNVGTGQNYVNDVAALSEDDVWVVGAYNSNQTLIMHWNGIQWDMLPSSSAGSLYAVTILTANDVWAVGVGITGTLTMHWDGFAWSVIPSFGNLDIGDLLGVTAISTNDVWAVGLGVDSEKGLNGTLTLHWDGVEWSIIPSPNPGAGSNILFSVAHISPSEVWAVGTYADATDGTGPYRTLVERYSDPCGTPTPNTPTGTPTSLVTSTASAIPSRTWTATTTTTFTATAAPPTSTATAGTATSTTVPSTATTIACTLEFTDVNGGNTFYVFIRCLACRGIISGYADGTFRPNNQITRGQLAKIVSNAAGFTESPDPQIFEDVPASNTFYQWIDRLARRGHMSGYACGGAGEPCTTGMPYFRPFANATRGQTSKIVSNAAGYSEVPTAQTFEDVPPTHTFYNEIQRLASRNIMQGYPCGGVGEPCVSGRPYFRPANNVTRGQSAKIVANTFYPSCETP